LLQLKNVSFKYDNSKSDTLKNVSFELSGGQIVGYIGPNGSGKTTTMKMLVGLLKCEHGEIKILGRGISAEAYEYKSKIGYMPENGHLYEHLTPSDYFQLLGDVYKLDKSSLVVKTKAMMSLFEIENVYDEKLQYFSKGMKQKFLLICSILHNPDIILLDEPLNGLDLKSVLLFKGVLEQLKKAGKLIFYSSHLIDIVEKICDKIIIINNGVILANGTLEEINSHQNKNLEEIYMHISRTDDIVKSNVDKFTNLILG